jgi:hypothetical protein
VNSRGFVGGSNSREGGATTGKTKNKFSAEVRPRLAWMVLGHEHEHPLRWAAIVSIATKIGCTGQRTGPDIALLASQRPPLAHRGGAYAKPRRLPMRCPLLHRRQNTQPLGNRQCAPRRRSHLGRSQSRLIITDTPAFTTRKRAVRECVSRDPCRPTDPE